MIEKINDIILKIELLEDSNQKKKQILKLLKDIDLFELEEYKKYYYKGCLWYLFPFETKKRDYEIEYNLKKSIFLNYDNIFSKTKLSFFFFDKRKYFETFIILKDINLSYFEEKGQIWKSLKLEELLLISQLYIENNLNDNLYNKFLSLISSYLILPDEEIAVPVELVQGVIDNKNKRGVKKLVKQINILINSKNFKVYFNDKIRFEINSIIESCND